MFSSEGRVCRFGGMSSGYWLVLSMRVAGCDQQHSHCLQLLLHFFACGDDVLELQFIIEGIVIAMQRDQGCREYVDSNYIG